MTDVPMPQGMSEAELEMWLREEFYRGTDGPIGTRFKLQARAVRALLREKVEQAAFAASGEERDGGSECQFILDVIVPRVLGDEPEGGADAR